MFEDKMYQKEIESEIQPQPIMQESNNYHPQSKLINKYFNTNNNNPSKKNSNNSSSIQQKKVIPINNNNNNLGNKQINVQDTVNELVNEKIETLNKNIEKLKR